MEKNGVTLHPKELQWILYRHVFAHICYVLQEHARTEIYVKRSIIPLLIVIKRQTWYYFVGKNVWNILKEKKMAILCCVIDLRAKTRAHAHVSDFL